MQLSGSADVGFLHAMSTPYLILVLNREGLERGWVGPLKAGAPARKWLAEKWGSRTGGGGVSYKGPTEPCVLALLVLFADWTFPWRVSGRRAYKRTSHLFCDPLEWDIFSPNYIFGSCIYLI